MNKKYKRTAKNIFPSSRNMEFILEVGFSRRKTRHLARLSRTGGQSTTGSVSSLGCLFCIRFKQTDNDKPLCSSPLSPSRLVVVSHSPLFSSCLTTYNYVVAATGMEPCRRKRKSPDTVKFLYEASLKLQSGETTSHKSDS